MKQPEIQANLSSNNNLSKQKDSNQFHETGQLRRAKMHAAYLIEAVDNNKALTPSLHRLLETSLVLETTDSKILATYLKQPPATVHSEFQRIRTILGHIQESQKVSSNKRNSFRPIIRPQVTEFTLV